MGTATAVALGIGGALALYLLFKQAAPAQKPPPCFTNVGGVPVPCDVISGLSTTVFNGLGAIAKNPGMLLPFSTISETLSDGLGSHNKCPPGSTDAGWRGCLDAAGKPIGHGGTAPAPLSPEQHTLIAGLGSGFGAAAGSSFVPTATQPVSANRWSPAR